MFCVIVFTAIIGSGLPKYQTMQNYVCYYSSVM